VTNNDTRRRARTPRRDKAGPSPLPDDWKWATTSQLCALLNLTTEQWYWLRSSGQAPAGYKGIGGKEVRYARADFDEWLAARRIETGQPCRSVEQRTRA
jgi:hypothetical protein